MATKKSMIDLILSQCYDNKGYENKELRKIWEDKIEEENENNKRTSKSNHSLL